MELVLKLFQGYLLQQGFNYEYISNRNVYAKNEDRGLYM